MAAPELRVLIVEDQEETRLLSAALLERHGLRVCGLARDGLEALARIRSERPDAVVLDLILPGLDGLGLLRALGRRDGGPVVVVTSQISDPAVSSLACRLGANYYYIKPVNFEELASLLRSICPGPRVRAARAMLEEMGAAGLGAEAAALTAGALAAGGTESLPLKAAYAAAMTAQHTSYACVEKNIRAMVGRLHRAGGAPYARLMGGLPPERPSNDVFLRRLAGRLPEM